MDEVEQNVRLVDTQVEGLVGEIRLYVRERLRDTLSGDVNISMLAGLDGSAFTEELEAKVERLDDIYDLQLFYARDLFRKSTGEDPERLGSPFLLELAAAVALSKQTVRERITSYTNRVAAGMLNNSISIFETPIEQVLNQAEGTLFSRLDTDIKTQVSAYNRMIQLEQARVKGIDGFLYAGPKDERNREFCAQRVNLIFTKAQIATWDNGQGLPADIYCGGYNCRHELVPVRQNENRSPQS